MHYEKKFNGLSFSIQRIIKLGNKLKNKFLSYAIGIHILIPDIIEDI